MIGPKDDKPKMTDVATLRRRARAHTELGAVTKGYVGNREAVITMLTMAMPAMLIALAVGLAISLFQALTQLQEMTLVFVPKIVATFIAVIMLLPFMLATLETFVKNMADRIIGLG